MSDSMPPCHGRKRTSPSSFLPLSGALTNTSAGMTLIEVLVATVVGVVVVGAAAAVLPKASQQSATQARDTAANVRVTKLTQSIQQEFKRGRFAGFTQAGSNSLSAILTTGNAHPVPNQNNLHTRTSLTIPGLSATAGRSVLLVSSTGVSKLVDVSSVSGETFTFNCATGLPSNASVKAYPAERLTLNISGNQVTSTVMGNSTVLGGADGLNFSYVYENDAGVLSKGSSGAATSSDGRLVGLLPNVSSGTERIDRNAMIALPATDTGRLLACNENAAASPNEARLHVSIDGLPSGVSPDVTLHGPDGNVEGQRPLSTQTYERVSAGTYNMTASDVNMGENIYRAAVKGSPTTLHNTWGDTYMQAKYAIVKGKVTVQISGLPTPPPTSGTVRFSGPENETLTAQNGSPVLELTPGDYSVSASPVGAYEPQISETSLHVGSSTNKTITVTYAIPKGAINLQVTGLPSPAPATGYVRVSGPEVQNVAAQTGTTSLSLKKGTYSITADQVGEYEPTISRSTVTVGKNTSTTVTVSYAIPKGPLALTVQGLPAGNSAALGVSGPQNQTVTVASGTTQTVSLQQGNYTVTAPEVTVGGTKYLPSPASDAVSLGKGGAGHTVTYTAAPTAPTPPGGTPPTAPTPPGNLPKPKPGNAIITNQACGMMGCFSIAVYGLTNDGKLKLITTINTQANTSYEVEAGPARYYLFAAQTGYDGGSCDVPLPGSQNEGDIKCREGRGDLESAIVKADMLAKTTINGFDAYSLKPETYTTTTIVPISTSGPRKCYAGEPGISPEIPCPPSLQ